ncbi:MAG: glycine cleavage system protein H [Lentisphaerae bacterium GWF2_52_8]|nr:MAG: glycine cleavage system protein H [Lentisphaerae bacterium GWF2_52_8]
MMKYYTKTHEWVRVDGEDAFIGISEHAAKELGDITYVELPKESTDLIVGDVLGVVESVKAASDVYSPISGTVIAGNKPLEDDPSVINSSPEEKGWLCKLGNIDVSELEELMDEKAYAKYLKSL